MADKYLLEDSSGSIELENVTFDYLVEVAATPVSGTGSLSLSGSGDARVSAVASASLDLTGTGAGAAPGAASAALDLSGSATWTVVGAAALALSASGDGAGGPSGSASLSLSGAGTAGASTTGTADLALSGSGAAGHGTSGSASLSLSGAGDLSGILAASGTLTLSLSATGSASVEGVAAASLSLTAAGDAQASASATGALSLSGSGAAGADGLATASLSLSAVGSTSFATSGTGTLTVAAIGSASISRSGTASLTLSSTGAAHAASARSGTALLTLSAFTFIVVGIVTVEGVGEVTIIDETLVFPSELRMTLLDNVVLRAPTSLTLVLTGAQAQSNVTFDIDGTDVYTVSTDSDGSLGPTSINLTTTLGTLGTHTITATQVTAGGTIADSEDFTVLRAPSPFPSVAGVDAPPVEVPGALTTENDVEVRHWVLQDLLAEIDGGIGSYVFPHNPRNMTSPHLEHAMTNRHSTASDGKIHVFQAGALPKDWTFTGYCPSEVHQEAILAYRYLNRRFWVIDHRNRAWKVMFTSAAFVPRLRQNYNGEDTDWGSDFTVTAVVLDQAYVVPA